MNTNTENGIKYNIMKSQQDSPLPDDGYQVIINKAKSSTTAEASSYSNDNKQHLNSASSSWNSLMQVIDKDIKQATIFPCKVTERSVA